MNRIGYALLGVTLFALGTAAQSQTGAQAGAQTNAQGNAQASKQGAQASGSGAAASPAAAQTGQGNAHPADGSTFNATPTAPHYSHKSTPQKLDTPQTTMPATSNAK